MHASATGAEKSIDRTDSIDCLIVPTPVDGVGVVAAGFLDELVTGLAARGVDGL